MEENDLLKERLQAITEKHRIQEDIRQKKLELDQEKLKLQHLKKKALREQWLLHDSTSHNAADSRQLESLLSDQQQARALQLSIHRIEMEVESLERKESMISTNENFIIKRLRAVEKSSEDIIKEVQDSFVPEPLQVTTVVPDVPESFSPTASKPSEQDTTKKTLFAMEINVTKNMLTGESTVLSTASVPPEELNQHAGLKVYDDGRKCVYALSSQEGSHEQTCVPQLSANEVEHLLRSATVHRQVKHQNYHPNPIRREGRSFHKHQDQRDMVQEHDLRKQGRYSGNHVLRSDIAEKDFICREIRPRETYDGRRYSHQEHHYWRQEHRNPQNNLRERHHLGNQKDLGYHYGNQKHCHHGSYQVINFHSAEEEERARHHRNGVTRSSSSRLLSGTRPNGFPPSRSHDQGIVAGYQPQLCYTPANYIPLSDYISVDEEELNHYSSPYYQSHNQSTAHSGPAHKHRVPSPLYGDDTPYTILNSLDNTEPITAIFMGFQTAQDDSGQMQELEGSLKAELVIIEDPEDHCEDSSTKEKSHSSLTNGNVGHKEGVGDRRPEKWIGTGSEEE
ncbi:palmdelphin isoform X2 [Mugil cephalus]|uniref:palmdelphin isoform X2 n=1 Tax=Mugil cephalus TaxID=48193 RepID=UPI001FB78FC7|nr:palmdelphin isoform X2 [Mugil cephalus]